MIKAVILDFNGVVEIVNNDNNRVLNDAIINFAVEAKSRGIKIAILSNYSSELRLTLKEYKIDSLFDSVILSGECGYKKPDKQIFEVLKNSLNVEYFEMLVVDDSEKTFRFQEELGYKYFLYKNTEDIAEIKRKVYGKD